MVISGVTFSCKFCSKVLTSLKGIQHHEQTVHLKRARSKCRMCDSTFSCVSHRSCHEKSSCKNRPRASKDSIISINSKKTEHPKRSRLRCRMCESTFAFASGRSCHERMSCRNRPGAPTNHSQVIPGASTNQSRVDTRASTNHNCPRSTYFASNTVPRQLPSSGVPSRPQIRLVTTVPFIAERNVPQGADLTSKLNPKH